MIKESTRSVPLPLAPDSAPKIDPSVWYAGGLQFACSQCGNCCTGAPGYVWVTMADMQRIAAYLKKPFDDFTRSYVRQVGQRYALTEKPNFDCSFFTRDEQGKGGCTIYPVRPTQCRTWPFWNENLKSRQAWQRAGERAGGCPGMCDSHAPLHDLAHIEACRQHPETP
jgi:uncharacterized protein